MKKKILYGVILLLLIITCPSCKNKNKDNNVPSVDPVVTPISNSQKLQILKSDLKLTQEQVMSRIKAENIKKIVICEDCIKEYFTNKVEREGK